MTRVVALIPARSGSERIPSKNTRELDGHPLIAYTIAAALDSGVFEHVIVSTDSEQTAEIARHYGAEAPFLRPAELAGSLSPDIEWVKHALGHSPEAEAFSLLRPTSPFRQADTIRRAWGVFEAAADADSLRAVEKVRQHPGKMWKLEGERIVPLFDEQIDGTPWHSSQYQALPGFYTQNGSLEIAWSATVREQGSIAGKNIVPFYTEGHEGFDINHPEDWELAEILIARGGATLPTIQRAAFTR